MKEDMKSCNVHFAYFTIILLGILMFIVGKNILKKIFGLVRTPQPHPFMIHMNRQLGELRKSTQQMSEDWTEMNNLMNSVRDKQNRFMFHLRSDLQTFHEGLNTSLRGRLREEGVRAEMRSAAMTHAVETLVTQVAQMRQAMRQGEEALVKAGSVPLVDGWSQTVECRKKIGEGKAPTAHDQETIKTLILVVKQALVEFLKEAQKNLTQERAEMMENVRVIFSQMAMDREDIKGAIVGAFSATTQQTQRCFEQLGMLGHDAVGCIVSLGDRSDKSSNARFQELVARTRDVSRAMKMVDANVGDIKDILDRVTDHLDEIYRKLELGQQKQGEQCGELADQMSTALRDFNAKSDALEAKHREMSELISRAKDAFASFDDKDGPDLQVLLLSCGRRVQLLTATLEEFVTRVETPMEQVVVQTERLTDLMGSRLGPSWRPAVLDRPSGDELLLHAGDSGVDPKALRKGEAEFKALMRGMYLKRPDQIKMLGGDSNAISSTASYAQDAHKRIQT